jgi:hypothetical protein
MKLTADDWKKALQTAVENWVTNLVAQRLNGEAERKAIGTSVKELDARFARGVANLQNIYPDMYEIVRKAVDASGQGTLPPDP